MKAQQNCIIVIVISTFYVRRRKTIKIYVFAYYYKMELQEGQTAVGLKYLFMKDRGWGGSEASVRI